MEEYDYGLDDLQDVMSDKPARNGSNLRAILLALAIIFVVVIGFVWLLKATDADLDATDRDRRAECTAQGGRVVVLGRLASCLIDGTEVAEWRAR